jgi:hypothetical protein
MAERDEQPEAGGKEAAEDESEEVMVSLTALWLPILLSAVVVFVVSSIVHMVLPWHKNDYLKIPSEDAVRAALRPLNIPPGSYMVPRPSNQKEMGSREFVEKMKTGPVLMVQVMPNEMMGMAKNLIGWFIYLLVISFFAAYITSRAVGVGANYLLVFRFVGTTAFMGYSLALWQMWIWYRRSVVVTMKSTIDGLVYACFTAGVFGWLWPR